MRKRWEERIGGKTEVYTGEAKYKEEMWERDGTEEYGTEANG